MNSPKLENAEKKGHYLRLLNVKKKTNLIGWFHRWLSSKLASSVWIRTSASNWRRYKRSMKPKWRAFNSDWKHRRRKCPLSPPKPKVGRQSPQQLPPPMLLHHHPLSYSAVDVDQAPRRTVLERHEHRSYWKNSIFLLFKIIWEKKKRKKKEKKPTETTSSPYSVTLFVPVLVVEQNMEVVIIILYLTAFPHVFFFIFLSFHLLLWKSSKCLCRRKINNVSPGFDIR